MFPAFKDWTTALTPGPPIASPSRLRAPQARSTLPRSVAGAEAIPALQLQAQVCDRFIKNTSSGSTTQQRPAAAIATVAQLTPLV